MSTIYQPAPQVNPQDNSSLRERGWRADALPIAGVQPLHPGAPDDDGSSEDGLYVSADSTPAENMRWLMLFQGF